MMCFYLAFQLNWAPAMQRFRVAVPAVRASETLRASGSPSRPILSSISSDTEGPYRNVRPTEKKGREKLGTKCAAGTRDGVATLIRLQARGG